MSAKSEELEGLREGEPVRQAPDALDETLVVDTAEAVDKAGATEGADEAGKADKEAGADQPAKTGPADPLAETRVVDAVQKADKIREPDAVPETADPLAETQVTGTRDETDAVSDAVPEGADPLAETQVTGTRDEARAVSDAVPNTDLSLPAEPRVTGARAVSDAVPDAPDPLAETRVAGARTESRPPAPGASGVAQDVAEETARAMAEAGSEAAPEEPAADAKPVPAARRERHTPLYGRGKRVLPWKHKSRLNPPQRRRRRIVVGSLWGCVLVFCGTVGWSVAGALTSPGTDTVQARLAEWGRDHGMGGLVATLEKWQYDLDPPKKGGAVDARQFTDLGPTAAPAAGAAPTTKPAKGGATPGKSGAPTPAPDLIAMQPRLPAPAGLTLESGEGVFQVAVQTPNGQPVVQVARIRPDAEYTDVAADVAWIDQKHSRYVLHPGHEGDLNKTITAVPNQINPDARPNLIALFNGGFKISESHGGYFDHGVTAAPLAAGAASEVIFKDGHMAVGMWGRDFSMEKNPEIVSVRQNLRLMVDNGQVVPYINDSSTWGRADHGSAAVWRSGVGMTASGDIVWVGGNKLTAPSLARLLKHAGAVRAMQLDINLRWADFQYFPAHDGNPDNSKLYEDFLQGPNKFFVNSTKDFMAVYLR